MRQLLEQVAEIVPKGCKLIVAVSGGLDSTVLLDLLVRLNVKQEYQLLVAHVDHALRIDSSSDANFVKSLAEKYQLPFFLKQLSNPPTNNIESWGRAVRYEFFAELMKEVSADWILTAHTADDQAETLLMKFFSNRELNLISAKDWKRKLIRPLVNFKKDDLRDYCAEMKLSYVEDASNSSDAFLRNKVRNHLLPHLEETFGTGVRIVIEEQSQKINQDSAYFNYLITDFLNKNNANLSSREARLDLLQQLRGKLEDEYSLAWRVIEELILLEVGFRVGYRACRRIAEVLSHQTLACEIPGGYRFSRSKGKFSLDKIKS